MAVAHTTTTTATATPATSKRKSSAAGLGAGGRAIKRRASKACHCCRSRKVRCDVVESGMPCTNCRLDEVECIVTEGKRRRKSYVDGDLFHQSPGNSIEEDNELPAFPPFEDLDEWNHLVPMAASVEPSQSIHVGDDHGLHHKPHMLYQTQGRRLSDQERVRRLSVISNGRRVSPPAATPSNLSMPHFPQLPARPNIVLPSFIQPIPLRIMSEDLEFLQRKGAFLVPETGFRNELLRCYAQYVHPFLPLIDLRDFLTSVDNNQPLDAVSLLLFQAVMFAGTAYVDMRYLIAQGYMSRKAARKSFFQRVKLLYDFDYELDRVAITQAALLMTYWYENPDDPKDVWHWLGVAISVARTIGVNCDTSDAVLMSVQQRRLWKRIWWSCYMRDRLIAIGMRRPMRIQSGDFDVSMLELSDFETDPLPAELSRMLGGCPAVKDRAKRVTLAKMCIGLTELCVAMTQILTVQYSTLGHKIGATQETTMRLVPKKSAADADELLQCDRELDQWQQNLPHELYYHPPGSRERTSTNDGEVINVHRALLTGIHLTAVSALHRPQILPSAPNMIIDPELRDLSKKRVRDAANDITEMYKELYAHDLIRYLPNTGVTCLLPAIIIHLLDIKSVDVNTRQASIRKFQSCMQALQRLREMYASADFSFSFLDAAVRKTNAQVVVAAATKPGMRAENGFSSPNGFPQAPVLLTPPPEALKSANFLLSNMTISTGERNLLAAYTPPRSDVGASSDAADGAAMAMADLSPEPDHEHEHEHEHEAISLQDEFAPNEFDSVVQLDGGHDLFASGEDGLDLDLDLNMQWLQDFNAEGDHIALRSQFSLDKIEEEEEPEGEGESGYAEQALNINGQLSVGLEVEGEA